MSSIRHTHVLRPSKRKRAPSRNESEEMSQRMDVSNSSGNATQGTNVDHESSSVNAFQGGTSCGGSRRGRTKRARTKLRMPAHGQKVKISPKGDKQFAYVSYNPKDYKYSTQLGVLLKREYPGLVQDKDEVGVNIGVPRPALEWADYYVDKNRTGETVADRVKQEFWNLFEVSDLEKEEAYRVFENYATKRVNDNMYQCRVDAVKIFNDTPTEELEDQTEEVEDQTEENEQACSIELTYDQYLRSRVDWCNQMVWPHLCHRWCSKEFKIKRKKAQESRLKSDDVAQNRGGSRAFGETSQFLDHKYGPGKGSTINTYAVMKSGIKNVHTSGSSGTISSQKAQTRLNDYTSRLQAAHPESNLEEQDVDGNVLYKASGGLPHGRVAIADGAVRKANVIAAGKGTIVRPQTTPVVPLAFQNIVQDNRRLHQSNERLLRTNGSLSQLNNDLILMLYADLGRTPSEEMQHRIQEFQAQQAQEIQAQLRMWPHVEHCYI